MVKKYLTTRYNCGERERERESLYSTRKGVLWFNSISNREWGERYLISHHSGDVL